MRKHLFWLGLFFSVTASAVSTFTTHYHIEKAADGDTNWGSGYRAGLDSIDTQLFINMSGVTTAIHSVTNAVLLETDQTITGQKTFTQSILGTATGNMLRAGDTMTGTLGISRASSSDQLHLIRTGSSSGDGYIGAATNSFQFRDSTATQQFNFDWSTGSPIIYFGGGSDANIARTSSGNLASNAILSVTGGVVADVTVITPSASRALVTDGSKVISSSSVTSTELGYVSGVTASIQAQINGFVTGSGLPQTGGSMSGAIDMGAAINMHSNDVTGVRALTAASVNVTGLTASSLVVTDAAKQLVSQARGSISSTGPIQQSNGANSTVGPAVTISITTAATAQTGALTAADWNTFNAKEPAQTKGNILSTTNQLTVANGTSATVGPGVTVSVSTATSSVTGLLTSGDWNTFNGKQAALSPGNISATGPINQSGGSASTVGPAVTISITTASATQTGALLAADWTTFNAKEPAQTKGSISSVGPVQQSGGANSTVGPAVTISITTASATDTGALLAADWTTFNAKEPAQVKGSISATGPIQQSNGANSTVGPAVTISITTAATAQTGALTAADWNTFNTGATSAGTAVQRAGDTMSGTLVISKTLGGNEFVLNSVSVAANAAAYQTNGVNRWIQGMDGVAEAGSDAGSGWQLRARTDAGGAIDNPLTIARIAGGTISLNRPVSVSGVLSGTSVSVSGLTASQLVSTDANKQLVSTALGTISSGDSVIITGGTNAAVGGAVTIAVQTANTSTNGIINTTDWNSFNGKLSAAGGSMSGRIFVIDGATATPGLSFTGQNGTGMHRTAAGGISYDTGGVSRMVINSDGRAIFPSTTTSNSFPTLSLVDGASVAVGFNVPGTSQLGIVAGGAARIVIASNGGLTFSGSNTGTAASGIGTLSNLPSGSTGDPTGYLDITINGTLRHIPFW